MSLKYDEVVRASVAHQVAENIRAAILDGRLQVDERLPAEEEMARSYGISRPTLREALKRLAAQNLIRSQRGPTGGNFVKRPEPGDLSKSITGLATLLVGMGAFDIEEIMTARLETETVCCRLAAKNRTDKDLAAIEAALLRQQDDTITDEEFCASDVQFHRALVDATHNGPLKLMMYTVVESFIPITNMIVFRVRERRMVRGFHRGIADAIAARNGGRAVKLTTELMRYLGEMYQTAVEQRQAARDRTSADADQARQTPLVPKRSKTARGKN